MRAHSRELRTFIQHDGLTIEGKSIAGNETYFRVRELGIALDVGRCPDLLIGVRDLFVTHAHVDHSLGIPFHAAQRKLQQLPPTRAYVPSESIPGYRALVEAHERLQQTEYHLELVGVAVGEEIELRRDILVRAHDASHSIPARAWEVLDVRETLRHDLVGLSGPEIRDRRLSGELVTDRKLVSRLFYTGDTDRQILERGDAIFHARILIIECSFTAAEDLERAERYRHVHLEDILEFADRFDNELILLTHFSLRDRPREIVDRIARRAPAVLRDRLRFAFPEPHDRLRG